MTKNLLKDMLKYLPAQITPGIVGFISIPVITRLFSPQDYGNYSLTVATVMVLTTLLGWLPTSIIRFYPAYEKDGKLETFYSNIVKLDVISVLFVAVAFLIILFSFKVHLPQKLFPLMHLGVGVFAVTAIFDMLQYFLRSRRKVNWYSGFATWRSAMGFGVGLGLIVSFRLGIEGLLWGTILSIGVILPLLWRKAVGSASVIRSKINPQLVKEMTKYSFPLVAGNLAAWILSLSDRYILGFFRGSQEVGIYSASYNISEKSVMLIVTLFMLASGPIGMIIWEKEGEEKSKEFVNKITRFYLLACIPAVVGLSVLSKPLINIMTGEQYFEGYKIIPFVMLGVLFLGLQQDFQSGFLYYKRTGFITFAIVVSGLLNLVLNFLFIPKHGYMGAAVTTFISYAFLLSLMIVGSRRIFVWKFPFKSLVKSVCASMVMGVVVYFIGTGLTSVMWVNLLLSVCFGGVIYFALLFLFQEFQPEEKEAMRQILNKLNLGSI